MAGLAGIARVERASHDTPLQLKGHQVSLVRVKVQPDTGFAPIVVVVGFGWMEGDVSDHRHEEIPSHHYASAENLAGRFTTREFFLGRLGSQGP